MRLILVGVSAEFGTLGGMLISYSGFFSHITTVSGCDRELNAHFYSAASLQYHAPDTWHDTTPSHIILTLPSEEQLVPFFTTLVCRSPGSNPWPPVPRSGHSTNWAIWAGRSVCEVWYVCWLSSVPWEECWSVTVVKFIIGGCVCFGRYVSWFWNVDRLRSLSSHLQLLSSHQLVLVVW